MLDYVWLIPLIPLVASLVVLFFGKEGPHSKMPFVSIAAMAVCFAHSLAIISAVISGSIVLPIEKADTWATFAFTLSGAPTTFDMKVGTLIDGPAAFMLFVVTLVSLLVQIYSLAYMHGDKRFKRYFAYLSFFTASMLGLIVSSNLLVTFACWELVGVSSYLLIGFWFEKPSAAYASKKAFMTTKLGDLGFYLALFLIFKTAETFEITRLAQIVSMGYISQAALTAIGLGLLCAAAGKSAQFPLFIWLPDAMEGPTPVSALIHAATMVAAGIYLVAKCYFVYTAAPLAMEAVAWIGLITAFMAATMALVAYDIKRVLAFSTVSQLGFMLCALGAGGYTAGLFHLVTHAFFKALLFLGAGSVIHSVHTNDMREMGGLGKKMIWTFLTMSIATLAIAGIWPLAGYFSKEAILHSVYEHSPVMFYLLVLSACMTAFYMTRLVFMTFFGEARDKEKYHHAHESPKEMLVPLVILAGFSIVAGFYLEHHHLFKSLVDFKLPEGAAGHHHVPGGLLHGVTAAVVLSITGSWWLYGRNDFSTVTAVKKACLPIFNALENRYGFDALFLGLVSLSDKVAKLAFKIDSEVIDKIFIDGWGLITKILAQASHFFDAVFVDRTVDGFGGLSWDLGVALRSRVIRGQVQEYLLYIAITVSLFAVLILGN